MTSAKLSASIVRPDDSPASNQPDQTFDIDPSGGPQ
jgi:hypothetical protein